MTRAQAGIVLCVVLLACTVSACTTVQVHARDVQLRALVCR